MTYAPCGKEEPEDVEQWEPMKCRHNRIAFQGSKTGTREWYWLQNKVDGSAVSFARVNGYDFSHCRYASDADGVRPVFKIRNHPQRKNDEHE